MLQRQQTYGGENFLELTRRKHVHLLAAKESADEGNPPRLREPNFRVGIVTGGEKEPLAAMNIQGFVVRELFCQC